VPHDKTVQEVSVEALRSVFLFIISVYALAVLFRFLLRVPSGGFSGNFFIPVSLILIIYSLTYALPNAIKNWTDNDESLSRAKFIGRGISLVAIFSMITVFSFRYTKKFDFEIKAARGHVYIDRRSGEIIKQTLAFIETNTGPDDYISVIPEGNAIAFLTKRRINFRHQILIPDFLSEEDELRAINKLKKQKIEYIFLTNRMMTEFGKDIFGRHFYTKLFNWIEANYEVAEVIGIPGEKGVEIGDRRYFIKVYKLSK